MLATLPLLALLSSAHAAPKAEAVTWKHDGTEFSGWLVYDDAVKDKRPGLLMVPNWMGANQSAADKAKEIAGKDYVVLVADVYGKDVRPKTPEEAGAAAGKMYADRPALRARAKAALDALVAQAKKVPLDTGKIGAIGFCFGGSTVLELARAGTDLDGVVSFHGGLASPLPAEKGAVKTPVLVLNGAADANVKPEEIIGFEKEMTEAGVDWQLVQFGGAVHCFAEADANRPPNCLYDARSAKRAYEMMGDFFDEQFAR